MILLSFMGLNHILPPCADELVCLLCCWYSRAAPFYNAEQGVLMTSVYSDIIYCISTFIFIPFKTWLIPAAVTLSASQQERTSNPHLTDRLIGQPVRLPAQIPARVLAALRLSCADSVKLALEEEWHGTHKDSVTCLSAPRLSLWISNQSLHVLPEPPRDPCVPQPLCISSGSSFSFWSFRDHNM